MRRTIFSSYLFLYPMNMGIKHNDYIFSNINAIGMGLSICNHSHSFHEDIFRRKLFRKADVIFMRLYGLYILYLSLYTYDSKRAFLYNIVNTLSIYYLFFVRLNRKRFIEEYDSFEKWLHFLFHIISLYNAGYVYDKYKKIYLK